MFYTRFPPFNLTVAQLNLLFVIIFLGTKTLRKVTQDVQ